MARKQASGEIALTIGWVYHYLWDNRMDPGDYRLGLDLEGCSLRRTGTIEGNIDKLIVRMMKNQGMNWTITGLERLLCVRFLVLEEKLSSWLVNSLLAQSTVSINLPKKKVLRIMTELPSQELTNS